MILSKVQFYPVKLMMHMVGREGVEPSPSGFSDQCYRPRKLSTQKWSRIRDSNPPRRFGRPKYYHYTNPAF